MSIKGDLPGLSNFCCGYIGSYQYNAFFSCGACIAPAMAGFCASQ